MSLLSVTVKKAHYVGPQAAQFNTYVTLKLQNVKSTTVTVKGADPCWEQDFLFETNDVTAGLLVEVWNKGMIWDRAIGYHWLPLPSVHISNEEGCGRWVPLAGELVVRGSEVVGTAGATGHALLLDCRFELPFDAEGTEAAELQRKLDLLNCLAGQERADQARRQLQYTAHSGYSEDSDYTSDLNYPVGQHANSSASQFRAAAHQLHTPQRSLETSRENSYERDEVMYGGVGAGGSRVNHDDGYGGGGVAGVGGQRWDHDPEPLYYNSRPRYHQEHGRRRKHDWDDDDRLDTWRKNQLCGQLSMESDASYHSAIGPPSRRARGNTSRRPSLERQSTLYDDPCDATPTYNKPRDASQFSQQPSYEEYFDTSSYPFQTDEDFTTNEEDRQWAGGGYYFGQDYPNADRSSVTTTVEYENTINKRRSSVIQLPQIPTKVRPQSVISDPYGVSRKPLRRTLSRAHGRYTPEVTSRGASLPATPPGTPKIHRQLPRPPAPSSLPPAPTTPRMLPRPPTATSQIYDSSKYYPKTYNEDYNYGYDSLEDNQIINYDGAETTDYAWPRKRLPSVTETPRKLPAPPKVQSNHVFRSDIIQDQKSSAQDQDSFLIDKQSYNQNLQSYTTDTQQSYSLDKTPYLEDQSYLDTTQTTYTTQDQLLTADKIQQPYIEEQQPYSIDDQQYMNDSFYEDAQTYVAEDKTYMDQDQTYLDNQTYNQEEQPSYQQQQQQQDETYEYNKTAYQNDVSYNHEETPYYDETQPYYDDQEPYHKDLPPYQQDQSYQQDAQQYNQIKQTPVTSYQDSNYIPYSTAQWMPPDISSQHVPVTSSTYAYDVPKSIHTTQPTSSTSTTNLGIGSAPIVAAAAAAQTFGLLKSGAAKLGSFLSGAAPKVQPTQPQPLPVQHPAPIPMTTSSQSPFTTQTSITRQVLRQTSVTESDTYHYPQTTVDSVPMMNNFVHKQEVSVSEANDDYMYNNQNVSMDRDLVKQDSLDYSIPEEDPSGRDYLRDQDLINDRGYLQNQNSLDSYTPDDIDQLNGVSSDYSKGHSQDSPVSVIHVDRLEPMPGSIDEEEPRGRGRGLENSLVEPYRPKQSPPGSRKTSMDVPYRDSIDSDGRVPAQTSLQDLLPEPTGSPPPDTRAPQDHRGEHETGSIMGSGSEGKAKSVSFEDEEADRCPVNPKERWLWAFRKINVSTYFYILLIDELFFYW